MKKCGSNYGRVTLVTCRAVMCELSCMPSCACKRVCNSVHVGRCGCVTQIKLWRGLRELVSVVLASLLLFVAKDV